MSNILEVLMQIKILGQISAETTLNCCWIMYLLKSIDGLRIDSPINY